MKMRISSLVLSAILPLTAAHAAEFDCQITTFCDDTNCRDLTDAAPTQVTVEGQLVTITTPVRTAAMEKLGIFPEPGFSAFATTEDGQAELVSMGPDGRFTISGHRVREGTLQTAMFIGTCEMSGE